MGILGLRGRDFILENHGANELTAVSLHAVLPGPPRDGVAERRAEERETTLLRVGKLMVAGEERLCLIRNISSAGTMLRLYRPVPVGESIQVEVTPGWPVPGMVIWTKDEFAGVAFAEPIDVVAALRGGSRDGPYRRVARTPRLQVRRPARSCTEANERAVVLCDLSLNGAKIATDEALAPGIEIAVLADGFAPLAGRVRWCRDGNAGIEFNVPLPIDTLASWLADEEGGGEG